MFTKGLLFVTVTVFIILLLASKKKYRCIIDQLDKKDYPIKYFLPVGMYMLDGLKYKYLTRLDLELMILVNQIYGIKNAKNYLKIFWANVLTMQFFTVVIVLLYIVAAKLEYSAVTTVVILLIAITLIAY